MSLTPRYRQAGPLKRRLQLKVTQLRPQGTKPKPFDSGAGRADLWIPFNTEDDTQGNDGPYPGSLSLYMAKALVWVDRENAVITLHGHKWGHQARVTETGLNHLCVHTQQADKPVLLSLS